jgi:hypothetical protein
MVLIQTTYVFPMPGRTPWIPVTEVEVPAKTYYHQYLQYRQMASKDFQGVLRGPAGVRAVVQHERVCLRPP